MIIALVGIISYGILLWSIGRKIPGRLRKHKVTANYKTERNKSLVVLIYNFLLALLIIIVFLLIKSFIRGEL